MTENEAQLAGRQSASTPASVRRAMIVTGREGERQLDDGRSGVREDAGRDGHDTDVLVLAVFFDQRGDLRESTFRRWASRSRLSATVPSPSGSIEKATAASEAVPSFRAWRSPVRRCCPVCAPQKTIDGGDRDSGEQLIEFFGREALLRDREAQ